MPPWLRIAQGELHVHETAGPGNNPRIIQYDQRTKLRAKEDIIPWCAAFACWCLEEAGFLSPESAAAKDFLSWGRAIERPVEGCIVVLTRPGGAHVGFYIGENAHVISILGGNQHDEVCIADFPLDHVLAYRMPPLTAWSDSGPNPDLSGHN